MHMTAHSYELVVIGGGIGGYVAAIRAAQLGIKVVCVEKSGVLGGTCLNIGCIPSKALLHSSEMFEEAVHGQKHGIVGEISLDLEAMMKRKDEVVKTLTKGVEYLFRKNKIDYVPGTGMIAKPDLVNVTTSDGESLSLSATRILIATGSDVVSLPGVTIDETRVISSSGALRLREVPKKLVIIGAGYIGLELGSVWRRLGAQVTIVDFLDRIASTMDMEVSRQFQKSLEKQGIIFKLGMRVTGVEPSDEDVVVTAQPVAGGNPEHFEADYALVAVGRRAYTQGLGLDKVGVALDERGCVIVNDQFETTVAGIYAVGDAIPGPMLAHKAEEDGIAAAESMAGKTVHKKYGLVPSVIYTLPEVACVGRTEEQLKAEGVSYKVGKFPFLANSRARTNGQIEGFVKILADSVSDEVYGVHVIGAQAGTMIGEAAVAMALEATSEDIARTCHSHPDLNEAIKEAALAVAGRAIHI